MLSILTPTRRLTAAIAILSLALLAAGCGDDDDGGNNNPTGPNPPAGDSFDQATAVSQAQAAAPQGVAMVQSMTAMAAGYGKSDQSYAYNEANQRWEYQSDVDQAGYVYSWFYTTQYLGAGSTPQREASGAESVHHTMNGTGSYSGEQSGYTIAWDFGYTYDVTMTGLGSGTLLLQGTGGTDIDYSYVGNGVNQSASYDITWQTLGDGISYPTSGCPSGTIRYDLAPYHLDLVFDGSSTVVGTLYDASGNAVAGGGSTHSLQCSL